MFLVIATLFFYLNAAAYQGIYLLTKQPAKNKGLLVLGFIAVLLHAYLLHHWIDVGAGQNLTSFNLLSLVTWLVSLLVLLSTMTIPVANLVIFIFPIAALSILLVVFFPGYSVIDTGANLHQLIHILLSTLAFSVLCIAALQALLLAVQERQLHRKHLSGIVQVLPSLETMEQLLFRFITVGFILLTIVLITSIWSFFPVISLYLIQKTFVSFVAWIIFAMLLVGRLAFGWRGKIVISWTLGGVLLLMLAYFGSQFYWKIV